jgi:hypothetical protein
VQNCNYILIPYTYISMTPLQLINFNSFNMQVSDIISCHVIFLHWKIFLKIQEACHISLCHVIFLNWKIILKIQENHLMLHHLSPLKNNTENSSSMSHHLMPCHLSLLKNNSKNSRKSTHATSPFSIKNNSKNSKSMPHHLMSRR